MSGGTVVEVTEVLVEGAGAMKKTGRGMWTAVVSFR